jgi:AAA+ ATPase superfamily predicted ATPase
MLKENPFNLGSVLTGEAFCNREKELNDLLTHAKNSANVILFSPRRFGKTSLIKKVMSVISRQGYLPIYVDLLSIVGEQDLTEKFFNAVVRSLDKDVTKSTLDKVKNLFTRIYPSIDVGPEGVSISARYDRSAKVDHLIDDIFIGLNKYLKKNKRKGLIVFDEFQELTGLPESKHIEAILREHIQNQNQISFFFVGSRRHVLQQMFADPERAFYRLGFIYSIHEIDRSEFIPYVSKRFHKTGKKCPHELAGEIYDDVGGNTYYVQKLSYIFWNKTANGGQATKEILDNAKNELLSSEAPIFQGMFIDLQYGEKKLVRALSVEPTDRPYAISYISRYGLSPGGVQKSIKSLIDKDIVENVNGTYRIVDVLFGRWCSRT